MPIASIFLPSHNKGGFTLEAIESVLAQTLPDWELWILENSTDRATRTLLNKSGHTKDPRVNYEVINLSKQVRADHYPTAWLLNRYYPRARGEYIFYLSDDDLFKPDCIKTCVSYLEANPDKHACYFSLECAFVSAPGRSPCEYRPTIYARNALTYGQLTDNIDGGQIVHRKSCLDRLTLPFFPEEKDAGLADAAFMEALARHYPFYPIREVLGMHRYTPLSVWSNSGISNAKFGNCPRENFCICGRKQ